MNSREKGKRGERQWRDVLRAEGYAARRGQQFSGSAESPDVICDGLPWIHFEVKCVERLNVWEAMEQALRDSEVKSAECKVQKIANSQSPDSQGVNGGMEKVPVVAHRRNLRGWLVTVRAEDFFRLLRGDFPEVKTEIEPRRHRDGDGAGLRDLRPEMNRREHRERRDGDGAGLRGETGDLR